MRGEEFLNKIYRDLNLSDEVMHTSLGTKNKDESVSRYMDRLERVHNKASRIDLGMLKSFYHKKYCLNVLDLDNYLNRNDIVKKQEESLDRWIDYFISDGLRYPMWAKYWAFHGMLKIGSFDRDNGIYKKRSKKTIAPFIEVDPEILSCCMDYIISYVGCNKVEDNDLKSLVESGNFSKLYSFMLLKKRRNLILNSNKDDGVWVKYNYETEEEADKKISMGIEPEYVRLFNSLQGYNTKWCTAGSLITAREQICGCRSYIGGDFYLYCTRDNNGEFRVPRIAIRMDRDSIGEIRGVADGQNIEEGFEIVVQNKLKEFNLDECELEKYLGIISDMKKLTSLNKKSKNSIEFNEEDIVFIYELERDIRKFGWVRDKRIDDILSRRNINNDFELLTSIDNKVKFIETKPSLFLKIKSSEEGYERFALASVSADGYMLECVDPNVSCYKEIAMAAVRQNGFALLYVDKKLDYYHEIAMEAVKQNGYVIKYIDKIVKNYKEMAIIAVKQRNHDGSNYLKLIDKDTEGYKDICMESVMFDGLSIRHVDKTVLSVDDYSDIAMASVRECYHAIKYITKDTKNYMMIIIEALKYVDNDDKFILDVDSSSSCFEDIALEVVKKIPISIKWLSIKLNRYDEIAMAAVDKEPFALSNVDYRCKNYKMISLYAITKNPFALRCVNCKCIDYKEIAIETVRINGLAIEDCSLNISSSDYKEIAMEAVRQNSFAISYVIMANEEDYRDVAIEAVKGNGFALRYVRFSSPYYKEIAIEAIKQNPMVLNVISIGLPCYKDILKEFEDNEEVKKLKKNNTL